ncbi:MAG: DUF1573 domain-containing protein [Bacteroidota bacterium]|nr:DUF1573 domain-containing protein [Bacteroidota bacterium]
MKKTLIISSLIVLGSLSNGCNSVSENKNLSTEAIENPATAENPNATEELATIQFESTEHDFGDIIENQSVEHVYVFKNIGKIDLLINNCEAACGCTVPSWPRQPIKPGESGEIKVIFDSTGKNGNNNKIVTVYGNIPDGKIILNFKANVKALPKNNNQ